MTFLATVLTAVLRPALIWPPLGSPVTAVPAVCTVTALTALTTAIESALTALTARLESASAPPAIVPARTGTGIGAPALGPSAFRASGGGPPEEAAIIVLFPTLEAAALTGLAFPVETAALGILAPAAILTLFAFAAESAAAAALAVRAPVVTGRPAFTALIAATAFSTAALTFPALVSTALEIAPLALTALIAATALGTAALTFPALVSTALEIAPLALTAPIRAVTAALGAAFTRPVTARRTT